MFSGRMAARHVIASAALALSMTAAAQAAVRMVDLAPADEYFGRAHMSPIEVSNRIRHGQDLARRDRFEARRSTSMLLLTQDALEDWSRRYPRDPWIVRDEHKLAPLFGDLETDEGNAGMHRCNGVLVRVGASPVLARTRAPHVRHVANAKRKPKRLFGFL